LTQGKSVQFSMEVVFLLHVVRFAPFLSSLDLSYLLFPVLFCGNGVLIPVHRRCF
jgi:hypothetical protein